MIAVIDTSHAPGPDRGPPASQTAKTRIHGAAGHKFRIEACTPFRRGMRPQPQHTTGPRDPILSRPLGTCCCRIALPHISEQGLLPTTAEGKRRAKRGPRPPFVHCIPTLFRRSETRTLFWDKLAPRLDGSLVRRKKLAPPPWLKRRRRSPKIQSLSRRRAGRKRRGPPFEQMFVASKRKWPCSALTINMRMRKRKRCMLMCFRCSSFCCFSCIHSQSGSPHNAGLDKYRERRTARPVSRSSGSRLSRRSNPGDQHHMPAVAVGCCAVSVEWAGRHALVKSMVSCCILGKCFR